MNPDRKFHQSVKLSGSVLIRIRQTTAPETFKAFIPKLTLKNQFYCYWVTVLTLGSILKKEFSVNFGADALKVSGTGVNDTGTPANTGAR